MSIDSGYVPLLAACCTAFLGLVGIIVNKMFADGGDILADNRKDKDDLHAALSDRVKNLADDLDACETKLELSRNDHYASQQKLQIFVFKWETLRENVLRVAKLLRDGEPVPAWMIESLERTEKASEVMSSGGESEK